MVKKSGGQQSPTDAKAAPGWFHDQAGPWLGALGQLLRFLVRSASPKPFSPPPSLLPSSLSLLFSSLCFFCTFFLSPSLPPPFFLTVSIGYGFTVSRPLAQDVGVGSFHVIHTAMPEPHDRLGSGKPSINTHFSIQNLFRGLYI